MERFSTKTARTAIASILAAAAFTALSGPASAASLAVKLACASDYYAYCSAHSPGSPAVRTCMRSNGSKLSNRCINALVGAGEVSASYVAGRRAAAKTASR